MLSYSKKIYAKDIIRVPEKEDTQQQDDCPACGAPYDGQVCDECEYSNEDNPEQTGPQQCPKCSQTFDGLECENCGFAQAPDAFEDPDTDPNSFDYDKLQRKELDPFGSLQEGQEQIPEEEMTRNRNTDVNNRVHQINQDSQKPFFPRAANTNSKILARRGDPQKNMSRFDDVKGLKMAINKPKYDQTSTLNLPDSFGADECAPSPESLDNSERFRNEKKVDLLNLDAKDVSGGPGDPAVRAAAVTRRRSQRRARLRRLADEMGGSPEMRETPDFQLDQNQPVDPGVGGAGDMGNAGPPGMGAGANPAEDVQDKLDAIQDQLDIIEDKVEGQDDAIKDEMDVTPQADTDSRAELGQEAARVAKLQRTARTFRRTANELQRKLAEAGMDPEMGGMGGGDPSGGLVNDFDSEVSDKVQDLQEDVAQLSQAVESLSASEQSDMTGELQGEPEMAQPQEAAALPPIQDAVPEQSDNPSVDQRVSAALKRRTKRLTSQKESYKKRAEILSLDAPSGDSHAGQANSKLNEEDGDCSTTASLKKGLFSIHNALVRSANLIKNADDANDDEQVDDSLQSVVNAVQEVVDTVQDISAAQQGDLSQGPGSAAPPEAPATPALQEPGIEGPENNGEEDEPAAREASRKRFSRAKVSKQHREAAIKNAKNVRELLKRSQILKTKLVQTKVAYRKNEDINSVLRRLAMVDKDLENIFRALDFIDLRTGKSGNGRDENQSWTDLTKLNETTQTREELMNPSLSRTDPTVPVEEGDQLGLAAAPAGELSTWTKKKYNDGYSTGFPPAGRQYNTGDTYVPADEYEYEKAASRHQDELKRVASAARAQVILAHQIADEEIKLGVVDERDKFKHFAKLEQMTPDQLGIRREAMSDVRDSKVREARTRKIATLPEKSNGRPSLGSRTASNHSDKPTLEEIESDDHLAFL